jgi:hypothetical protein
MTIVSAICPNCGANIQISAEAETAKCIFCSTNILVKDAIQTYKSKENNEAEVSETTPVEQDIARGNCFLASNEWEKAYYTFRLAIKKQANQYDAWMGCLTAMTDGFSRIDFAWAKQDGLYGLESILKNCLHFASEEQLPNTIERIKQISALWEKGMEEDRAHKANVLRRGRKFIVITYWTIAFLMCLMALKQSFLFLFALLFFFIGFYGFHPIRLEQCKDKTLIDYASKIKELLAQATVKR